MFPNSYVLASTVRRGRPVLLCVLAIPRVLFVGKCSRIHMYLVPVLNTRIHLGQKPYIPTYTQNVFFKYVFCL
jgi:hypothetical protein